MISYIVFPLLIIFFVKSYGCTSASAIAIASVSAILGRYEISATIIISYLLNR